MKIAVVTASVGTNKLLPQKRYPNVDYHAFVDKQDWAQDPTLACWTQHSAIKFSVDLIYANRRNAKIYKIIPFMFLPDYDYHVWMDCNHVLFKDPNELIDEYLKDADVAVFKHHGLQCVYQEGKAVKDLKYDHSHLVDSQLLFYKSLRYPSNNGLYELPFRIQRNNEATKKMGFLWWEQICMYSSRDQISFPFVCHQLGIKLSILPGFANSKNGNPIAFPITISQHSKDQSVLKWYSM